MAKAPSEKTLDELAEDMHTRPEGLTHLTAKAEMELRRTSAQRRATTYMFFVASTATAVSAAAAAITAGIAAYVAFMGLFESSRVTHFFHRRVLGSISPGLILTASSTMMQSG